MASTGTMTRTESSKPAQTKVSARGRPAHLKPDGTRKNKKRIRRYERLPPSQSQEFDDIPVLSPPCQGQEFDEIPE